MKKKGNFTLFEIILCVALLGIVASVIGFNIQSLICAHRFHKDVDQFYTALRKAQILALTDKADILVHIRKTKGKYTYLLSSDEPIKGLVTKSKALSKIDSIKSKGKEVKDLRLQIYSTGRVEPKIALDFFTAKKAITIDLSRPLLIHVKTKEIAHAHNKS